MAEFSFVELQKELDDVRETGVSFEGKSQKWETKEAVQSLINEIDNCSSLFYLNLEGNTLGVEAAKLIGKALERHPEFKKALWKDLFTGRLKTEIPDALRYLGRGIIFSSAKLSVLDCSDNALGPNGMKGLIELLSSPACYSLQELKLNNCGLGIGGGKMLSKALLDCHKKSTEAGTPLALKVFIAGRNRLENEGAKALSKVFSELKTLEEVCMPQNGIYFEGITALSEAFQNNKNMKILNLNDNTIRAKGAESLAEAFIHMQKLREINFGDCLLKTKGALLLAYALNDNHPDLEVVNFGFNEIGIEGGIAVASAMQNKTKIRSVILGGNQFGFDGCEQIKDLFEDNITCNLSEDEGEESNESENDDEDEDDNDEEKGETDDEENISNVDVEENLNGSSYEDANSFINVTKEEDLNLTINQSVTFVDETELSGTIENFCKTPYPTIKFFNSIEIPDKIKAFKDYYENNKDDEDEYLQSLVFVILKCSALSEESKEALDVAESLYKDAFDFAEKTNQVVRVQNFFLIQLGLLKSEDKSFRPLYNIHACRYALEQILSKNIFVDNVQKTFTLFLEKFAKS